MLASTVLCDWLINHARFSRPVRSKTNPTAVTCLYAFSRALRRVRLLQDLIGLLNLLLVFWSARLITSVQYPTFSLSNSFLRYRKEEAALESAAAAATDVTTAMLAVKIELEEKKRTNDLLQRALVSERQPWVTPLSNYQLPFETFTITSVLWILLSPKNF